MAGLLRAQRVLETLQDFPGLIGVPTAALQLLDNLTLFPDVFGTAADALFGLGKTTPDASTIHVHLIIEAGRQFSLKLVAPTVARRWECSKCGPRDVQPFAIGR
jgi:hypothetical protein